MIENERKYVLDIKNEKAYRHEISHMAGAVSYEIKQGYLESNSRIRASTNLQDGFTDYFFTYKLRVNGKLVEIETRITKADFDLLWLRVDPIITKVRVKVPFQNRVWEVDFFKRADEPDCYLIMAEVELPEDMLEPEVVPDFIKEHQLHLVEINDKRFNNKQLTRPKTVRQLVKDIKDGKL